MVFWVVMVAEEEATLLGYLPQLPPPSVEVGAVKPAAVEVAVVIRRAAPWRRNFAATTTVVAVTRRRRNFVGGVGVTGWRRNFVGRAGVKGLTGGRGVKNAPTHQVTTASRRRRKRVHWENARKAEVR